MTLATPPTPSAALPVAAAPDRASAAPARSAQDRALLVLCWLVMLGLIGAPLVYVVVASISVDPIEPAAGFTARALQEAFGRASQWWLLAKSMAFSLVIGVLSTVVAAGFAWTTVRLSMRGTRIREVLILGALFVPSFVTAVAWVWLGTPETGLINKTLGSLGVPGWLHVNVLSIWGMIFILVTHHVPYAYLFISASMRRIDSRMEEASLMCGRGSLYTTLRVSMPLLRASILSSMLFIAILSIGEFSVPQILGQQGAFRPLSVTIYRALYGEFQDYAYAAAVAVELMLVSLIGLYLYSRTVRNGERFVSVTGRGLQHSVSRPTRRTASLVWAVTVVYGMVAFLVPLAAMVLMALSAYLPPSLSDISLSFSYLWDALNTPGVRQATLNTLELAVVVPIVCIAIALVVVYLSDRVKIRGAAALSYLATAPLAVPGLVMGTGLLLFLIRTPFYGTLAIIGVGMVAICVTHAIRLVSNGLKQIDPSLEEASRMCGVSGLATVRKIVMPLIRPSLFSAFVLIFVLTLRELTVAVVLYSPNTQVLSVVAWNYSTSALNRACAVGLLQLVIMLVSVPILRAVFRLKRGES
ncbi:MAG: iron ABC transporter permease [Nocardioides sp.]|uniref:ABC transporter permease n=1 Tax=Nocardioides sp. TaxID=35761 RepID=UPI0039E39F20